MISNFCIFRSDDDFEDHDDDEESKFLTEIYIKLCKSFKLKIGKLRKF